MYIQKECKGKCIQINKLCLKNEALISLNFYFYLKKKHTFLRQVSLNDY